MTVEDFLNVVYDEQWVRLVFDDSSHENHIDVWGADWIGGYEPTLEELEPWLNCEVDDMVVEENDDPELDGETAQMICVTVYPTIRKGKKGKRK